MVFVDRLLATLVHLRHGVTHDALACWFGVNRSTVTRAIGEARPLLAERGCTISPDVRLRTLADVIGHLGETGKTGIIDGTEIRVRRPAVGRNDRDKFISGKNKQNAVKAMVLTDEQGRLLFCSPTRPGSCERRRKAHSSRRIRVEHGIAHLENWRALARHLGRRERMDDTVQAFAGLLSQQQTADRILARQT
ncbi:transposase family protein [Streptomyces anulatus]|uniref:transposase family protein n=1 Tax=Streptomyces anulatus TaxID=1892 RepID=UPI00367B724F